ncbi:hypothetical protein FQZ97_970800 [compost metagenome]
MKGRLRLVACGFGDARDRLVALQQPLCGIPHALACQVAHGGFVHQGIEALGEGRTRQTHLARQLFGGPAALSVSMQQGQGAAHLGVAQARQPAGAALGLLREVLAHGFGEQQLGQPTEQVGRDAVHHAHGL